MATRVSDTLTDTNGVLLHNHVGEVGATWTKRAGVDAQIDQNAARAKGGTALYVPSGRPTTTEYRVTSTVLKTSNSGAYQLGVHLQAANDDRYYAGFMEWENKFRIWKNVSGVETSLAVADTTGVSTGDIFEFVTRGSGVRLELFINSVSVCQSNDTSVAWSDIPFLQLYQSADADYQGIWCDSFTVTDTAAGSPPGQVTGLSGESGLPDQVDLSWTDLATETGYKIERAPNVPGAPDAPGTFAQIATTGANVTVYSNTGLTASTKYWYRVRGNNLDGDGAYSANISVTTTAALTAPAAPTNLGGTAISTTQIDLTWTDASNNEASFRVERAPNVVGAPDAPGTFAEIGNTAPNVAAYSSTGLTQSTKYWFRVRARNAAGDSAYTASVAVTTLAPVVSNAITLGGLVTDVTMDSIGVLLNFTGDDNASATAVLEYKRTVDPTYITALPIKRINASAVGGGRFFRGSILKVTPGTSYNVRVTVTDADGGGGVVSGTATARSDDVIPASSIVWGGLTTDRFVDAVNGNDANPGTAAGAAWKTLIKVMQSAPSGARVRMAPGYYSFRDIGRETPISLYAQYPALQWNAALGEVEEINPALRTVIFHGSGDQYDLTQRINVIGPATATAAEQAAGVTANKRWTAYDIADRNGVTRRVWKVENIPGYWASTGMPIHIGSSTTLLGTLQRHHVWDVEKTNTDTTIQFNTPNAWVDTLYNNQSFNYGAASFMNASGGFDTYVRLPGTASGAPADQIDPNSRYVTFGSGRYGNNCRSPQVRGLNSRISGIQWRLCGPSYGSDAQFGVIDHCISEMGGLGYANVGSSGCLTQYCKAIDYGLWKINPLPGEIAPWNWIKSDMINASGVNTGIQRVGAYNETGGTGSAGRRNVWRFSIIDGPFNGWYGGTAGMPWDSAHNNDLYGIRFRNISDDCIEPEQAFGDIRVWDCDFSDSMVVTSIAPLSVGPYYLFNSRATRISTAGGGRTPTGQYGGASTFWKLGLGGNPIPTLFWFNCSFYASDAGSRGSWITNGGPNMFHWWMRNVLAIAGERAWDFDGVPAQWDDNYNFFVAHASTAYGAKFGAVQTTIAGYRTATGQGAQNNRIAATDYDLITGGYNYLNSQMVNLVGGGLAGLALTTGSAIRTSGIAVPNYHAVGATPDRGATAYVGPSAPSETPPAAPTTLAATAISTSQINLTWVDASNNETGFRVERSGAGANVWTEIALTSANAVAYSATDLFPNTAYDFRVRATNAYGNSSYSNIATATTQAPTGTVPTAPTGLTATAVSPTQINLGWTDTSNNETEFLVERSLNGTSGWVEITALIAGTVTFPDVGLSPSTQYFYRVRARNASGYSSYTSTANATTLPSVEEPPPVAPPAPVTPPLCFTFGTAERLVYLRPDGVRYNLHAQPSRTVLSQEGFGTPPIEYVTDRAPFQHGETVRGFSLGSRPIQITVLQNFKNRPDYWRGRAEFLDTFRPNRIEDFRTPGKLLYYLATGQKRQLDVFLESGPGFAPPQDGWRAWSFTEVVRMIAFEPAWYDPDMKTVVFGAGATVATDLVFPATFPILFSAFGGSTHLQYRGTWKEYPTILLTGPLTNPVVTNHATGDEIGLDYIIQPGETVTIKLRGDRTVTNNSGVNLLNRVTADSDLSTFSLEPAPIAANGVNVLSVAGTESNLQSTVAVQYFNRYFGI